jgi:putative DNA primase/helicase
MKPVDLVLERVADYKRRNGYYMAPCPAHEDPEPSLSIKEGRYGRALLHCFAGCETTEVVGALGLEMSDLFPSSNNCYRDGQEKMPEEPMAAWDIRDATGELQAVHVRFDRDGGKECLWRLPDDSGWGLKGRKLSTLPLYGSERLSEWPEDVPVIVAEGEKATEALLGAGFAALGTVTGAGGTPGREALEAVRGRRVVLWPDNDEGRRHMDRVAEVFRR